MSTTTCGVFRTTITLMLGREVDFTATDYAGQMGNSVCADDGLHGYSSCQGEWGVDQYVLLAPTLIVLFKHAPSQ